MSISPMPAGNGQRCKASAPDQARIEEIRAFWDNYVYDDVRVARERPGSPGFYAELDSYRQRRLTYLPQVVDFAAFRGKRVLDIGCRVGLDLARFAKNGALVTGVDLSERCIGHARRHFQLHGLEGTFHVMDGEDLRFANEQFDLVYSHGVLPYTLDDRRMVQEMYRVLKPGGELFMMVYARYSWLRLLSQFSKEPLLHEDAPVFRLYSAGELSRLLRDFSDVDIIAERFPEATGLHRGLLAKTYYAALTGIQLLPRRLVSPFGAHLIARARRP